MSPGAALALVAGAYLLGSISFSVVVVKVMQGLDVRSVGSGNAGATNVMRAAGKGAGVAVLALDVLKGMTAVAVPRALDAPPAVLGSAAVAVVLGHVFPVWLNFKGGKGVATYIGVLIAVYWPVALSFGVIWVIVAGLWRYSSLAGLIATLATPALPWVFVRGNADWVFAILTALVWFMHRGNISRLLAGTEAKIGSKTATPSSSGG